jgi:hypothetical protein
MSTKPDDEFVATAADPARRLTAITDITKRRNKCLWIVGIITLGFFGICFFGSRQPDAIVVFMVLFMWIQLFKYESDLRLLLVIDRLQTYDRPVA